MILTKDFDPKSARGMLALLIPLAILLIYVFLMLGSILVDEYRRERHRQINGVKVEGTISGFVDRTYTEERMRKYSGSYPELSYATPSGQMKVIGDPGYQIPVEQQAEMLGQKLTIIYLPENPKNAVVLEWHENPVPNLLIVAAVLELTTLIIIGSAFAVWRKRSHD